MLNPTEVEALKRLLQMKVVLPLVFKGDRFDAFTLGVQQTFDLLVGLPQLGFKHAKAPAPKQADSPPVRRT